MYLSRYPCDKSEFSPRTAAMYSMNSLLVPRDTTGSSRPTQCCKVAPLMLELVSFQTAYIFFTESASRLIQSISCDIHDLSACLSVQVFGDTASRWTGDFWSISIAVNLAYP